MHLDKVFLAVLCSTIAYCRGISLTDSADTNLAQALVSSANLSHLDTLGFRPHPVVRT